MTEIDMKKVEEKANELNNDIEVVERNIKRLSSSICRLNKQKFKSTYQEEMTKLLQEQRLIQEVKRLLKPKKKSVPELEQSDVDLLDYDETIKAIKSIQSKKHNTLWLSPEPGNNDEYRNACKVEQMLLDHKSKIRPIDETTIRKTELVTIIETIENNQDLTNERILELLKNLI